MKPPNALSDGELRSYAEEHLRYEMDMLIWSAGILVTLATIKEKGQLPWALNNSVLESFSIHARNLIDFLYSGSRNKDRATDIVVEDYVDQGALSAHLPPITRLLEESITKANKQVAHLTKERIDYEKAGKAWSVTQVAQQTVAAFNAIAPHFPSSRVSDKLRHQISQASLRIPSVRSVVVANDQGRSVGVELTLVLLNEREEA
jgi:hypothetical protein